MKRIFLSALAVATLLTSCKESNDNDETLLNDNGEVVSSYDDDSDNEYAANDNEERKTYTKEEAGSMAEQMKTDVEVKSNNTIAFKNFTAYGELQNEVKNLSIDPDTRAEMNTEKARAAFQTFKDGMPSYLNTMTVRKEIDDVEMAMEDLYKDVSEDEVSQRIVTKRINRVKDAVSDLNDEIIDVRLSLDEDSSIDFDAYTDFVNNVNYDNTYVVTIVDFNDYEVVKQDRESMNDAGDNEKMTYADTLIKDFKTMLSNMPQYLKIDDVMDAVEDVQKEMKEYQDERNNPEVSMDENMENLEEIDEALYDLNKEFIRARKKYDRDRKNAIDNYMEELNG